MLFGVVWFGVVLLVALLAFRWSEERAFARLADAASHELDLYGEMLDSELGKQADLPGLVDADGEVEALLLAPDNPERRASLNRRLTRFVARAGVLSAAAVDARGSVLASSDWYRADSRVGHWLPNEPCVSEALTGQEARRFSANPYTGAPEVCFARPVVRDGQTLGAVLLHVSLEPIEATWIDAAFRNESEKPLVVDGQGVVIMSSVPEWKTRPLAALVQGDSTVVAETELVRLQSGLSPYALHAMYTRALPRFGWRLLILSSTTTVWQDARAAAWSGAIAAACAGLLIALVLQRRRVLSQKLATRAALERANDELEAKVRERTAQLEASNQQLRREVKEREHAEHVLRQAQEELVQAGKLALLGQLSAGISHELGQPLTALRALADNGRVLLTRGALPQAMDNFAAITGVAERMGRITSQLKSFAHKAPLDRRALHLREVVESAAQLLASRLVHAGVEVQVEVDEAVTVHADGYRLEQVLVNLLANAIDALIASPIKRVTVQAQQREGRVQVRVSDTGPGLSPQAAERLFEPFFTSKPPGEGLGLGLVISSHIVREFGGTLRVVPSSGGATFEFDLPPAAESIHV